MRIAFTSCCDPLRDAEQTAWETLAEQQPDVLLLLGDNIYMDYGLGAHIDNGQAIQLPLPQFSHRMHGYYSQQWAVPRFRRAVEDRKVFAIWDDHDFGCNNGRGADPEAPSDRHSTFVPPDYRRCARELFEQFRSVLTESPAAYPPNPVPNGLPTSGLGGIQKTIDLSEDVRLHLLDGRSFRTAPGAKGTLLGREQREALEAALLGAPDVNLLASGTTLKDWKNYGDFDWLRSVAKRHRIVVLSGDIHEPDFRSAWGMFEATASAMAQPPGITEWVGKKSDVFGLLDVATAALTVSLWHRGKETDRYVIDRANWKAEG